MLALGEELFDKPGDLAAARAQLQRLRGRTHHLHTAVALAQAGEIVWTHVGEAVLAMRAVQRCISRRYLAEAGAACARPSAPTRSKACGIQLFERVEGDNFTIIGLPLLPLLAELRARGAIDT